MSFCPLPLLYPSASDFQFRYAPVTVGSGRVGLTCETCIYKISYQILFGFTVEYVLVREKFFMKKVSKYHLLAECRDKSLIYNRIEE